MVVEPAVTVADAGTVSCPLLLESETTAPPVGAAADKVIVHVDVPALARVVGLQASELTVTGGAVTFKVTPTVWGLLAAPVDVTETVPVYVPTAIDEGLTDTVTVDGVVPPADAESQLPPDVVDALVVYVSVAPLLLVLNVCEGGVAPPTELNVSDVGATEMLGFAAGAVMV